MIPYKARVNKSVPGQMTTIKGNVGKGYCVTVQAVYYSSTNPGNFLHLYDADGDEFMFALPGQGNAKVATPEIPVTVKLPLKYVDVSIGEHQIKIFGEAHKISKVDSNL